MREAILNHASLKADNSYVATGFLRDIACGMAEIVRSEAAAPVLRTMKSPTEIPCAPGTSLFDAMLQLQREGAREEYILLSSVLTKVGLPDHAKHDRTHRFWACEAIGLTQDDGKPLLLCALDGAIAVGFPARSEWDRDRIVLTFDELHSLEVSRRKTEIDHLARVEHAALIIERHWRKFRANLSPKRLWENRKAIFPYLTFGPEVKDHLQTVPRFHIVVERLTQLNDDAERWRHIGGVMPRWTHTVVNESELVRNDPRLRKERLFRSCSGKKEFFFWHARFDKGWRIHLRFCPKDFAVEIGYIGKHLCLPS